MGFFKIDRQVFEHWVWSDKPFSKGQAWVDLIGLANYEDSKTLYNGHLIDCERGTVYRSISFLARRWGWGREKVRNYLRALENDGMIRIIKGEPTGDRTGNRTTNRTGNRTTNRTGNRTDNRTAITLLNYGKYQDWHTDDRTGNRTGNQPTNRQQTDQKPANEIRNKNKEIKNNNARAREAERETKKGIQRRVDLDEWLRQQTARRAAGEEKENVSD